MSSLGIHQPGGGNDGTICICCLQPWPCLTAQAKQTDERAAEALAVAWHAYAFSFPPGKMPSTPFTGFKAGWHARDAAHAPEAEDRSDRTESVAALTEDNARMRAALHDTHSALYEAVLLIKGTPELFQESRLLHSHTILLHAWDALKVSREALVQGDPEPGGFARARGAVPFDLDAPTPEATIRRLRGDDDGSASQ